jgi:hypothetical protein
VTTVLFAWELGAGSGHLMNIRRLAQRLQARGIRVVAAVTSLAAISALDGVFNEIHRMPHWPGASADAARTSSSATLNDILVSAGLADTALVGKIADSWMRLLGSIKPALVVADFAPAAALVARRRVPLMLIGNGYTLPPDDMPSFPLLHALEPPRHDEEDTLAAVNAAAGSRGLQPLSCLPQLFSGDAHLVHTLPLLDPYTQHRRRPVDGPLIDYAAQPRRADARKIFAYISDGVDVRDDVVAALRPVAARLCIHAPMLSEDACAMLAGAGARIADAPVDLAKMLPECRLVVHLGGSGLAAEALLAGVPQLTLVTHVEQHLTGLALERAGIGRCFTAFDPASALAASTIVDLLEDETMAQRATEIAMQQSNGAPLEAFDSACAQLLR